MRTLTRVLGWLTVGSLLLSSGLGWSQKERGRPLLLGGPLSSSAAQIPLDPRLPRGALRHFSSHPPSDELPACSFRYPVCVTRTHDVPTSRTLLALASLERAYRRLVVVLGLPAPTPVSNFTSPTLELRLSEDGPPMLSTLEALSVGLHDSGASSCESSATSAELLERAATQCVGEAIGRRLDAGTTPHLLRAYATSLWWVTGQPTALDVEAVDHVQQRPQEPLVDRDLGLSSEGAALWFEQLEARRGLTHPGKLSTHLLALAASMTPADAPRWHNEPDIFDVLRHSTGLDQVEYARLLNQVAIDRAFVGTRDDGTHLPSLGWTGDFGRIRFDWLLKYSSLPRRVAAREGIAPTGAFYVLLELDDVALDATLGFRAEWEPPVAFAWSLVQVDEQGREMKRLEVPFQAKATRAEQRLVDFQGAAYVLAIGTNLGGLGAEHPFDPDIAPYETHGCTVYLAAL